MSEYTVSGVMLRDMILTGAAYLERNKENINALNVFPVPDGDTGTNMSLTMQSAVKSVQVAGCDTVTEVADALSLGALKGARGNSGVILSQICRGFARALKGAQTMDAKLLAAALEQGTEAAYKAVMRPREGTMLTVIKAMAQSAQKAARQQKHIPEIMDILLETGECTLKKTPDMLPVLKEAGVVDSGGMGILAVFYGFGMALNGDEVEQLNFSTEITEPAEPLASDDGDLMPDFHELEEIKFGYCTELFVINLYNEPTEDEIDKLREKLGRIGDSVVVAYDDDFMKLHVHTDAPGKAIQLSLHFGEVDGIKIDNMRKQNRELIEKRKAAEKECAVIAVCAGDGVGTMFRELGAGAVIQGGQTMNPSIESIAKAIRRVNARNVFVLPNNSNIVLAAQQAAALTTGCNTVVIPTKSVMQGISAIMAYNSDNTTDANTKKMNDASAKVISGSVTYSVRSSTFDGNEINEGDILAMLNSKIVASGSDILSVSCELLRNMLKEQPDDPVVTIIYGEGMDENNANEIVAVLENEYEDAEFIIQYGGQPLYYYYFAVE